HLVMLHGSVVHGGQYVHDRPYPATAFGPGSLLADAIRLHPRRLSGQPLRIGVVGMGVGTIAAYGLAGDVLRLYELNPQVAAWARGEGGFFSYLRDTRAGWDIRLGDARLVLERERAAGDLGQLDVLVIDAFSSASPPVHLLTLEAFQLYLAHLRQGGVLAVHLSNANLDLVRLAARQAEQLGLPRVFREHTEQGHTWGAAWMLMTRNEELLARPELAPEVKRPGAPDADLTLAPWTDGFSNLFDILY
ncbi:MAG TPA: ferrichrome ABC transporter permease, partial [Myxococcota bacterium]|nr:ferrichrome ABC transporter permease [Myxococcota bacterium]